MKKNLSFLFVIFTLSLSHLHAQSMNQNEIQKMTGARLLWDQENKKGIFLKNRKTITFIADQSILLLNGRELYYNAAIVYEKGNLIFSQDTADFINQFFLGDKSEYSQSKFRIAAIILDPGHGGRDSGATKSIPVDGLNIPLHEKNLVLEITLSLKEMLLSKYKDKEIILTRSTDIYPSLEDRVALANSYSLSEGEGVIYISIHANASLNQKARGYEVWYLPDDFSRQVLETDSEQKLLEPILNILMEEEFSMESKKLAAYILDALDESTQNQTLNRGLKEESWFVVRNAKMASVLIETGFISNDEELNELRKPEYLKQVEEGIYNGIVDFVDFFEK